MKILPILLLVAPLIAQTITPITGGNIDARNRGIINTNFTNVKNSIALVPGTVISVSGANGLTGNVTTTGSISGINAAADGSTLGVAAFTANDFNAATGVISLDYVNAQKATGSVPGFLASADWTTFNAKPTGSGAKNELGYWTSASALSSSSSTPSS